jgi:hypothetical protein
MNAIVIEHVPVAELPAAWRAQLAAGSEARVSGARVTVRIEEEAQPAAASEEFVTDDPAFGIWRDRADMADVEGHKRIPTNRLDRRLMEIEKLDPKANRQITQLLDTFIEREKLKQRVDAADARGAAA